MTPPVGIVPGAVATTELPPPDPVLEAASLDPASILNVPVPARLLSTGASFTVLSPLILAAAIVILRLRYLDVLVKNRKVGGGQ